MKFRSEAERLNAIEEIRKAYEAGALVTEIMKSTGRSKNFIHRIVRELGLTKRAPGAFHEDHPGERRCGCCKVWHPVEGFRKDPNRSGGLRPYCEPCERIMRIDQRRQATAVYLCRSTRNTAKARGLTHAITPADIIVPETCPVLGIPLFFDENGRSPNSPSVDRIDNNRGYEPGNVHVISFRANKLRGDATGDELQKLAAFFAA